MQTLPEIIQGGMGVAVSNFELARAVAQQGQLGVVSGTALDSVLARRLQRGDPGGAARLALRHFPDPQVAEQILATYLVAECEGGVRPFVSVPMFTAEPTPARQQLAIAGGFVEVWLAKQGHAGLVGINFLEKIQLPTPATLYGALLAGVDYVLVGAGIPRDIPGLLDNLCRHEPVSLPLHVSEAAPDEHFALRFSPRDALSIDVGPLRRPQFLAIIASATLAISLVKRGVGVDGFIVEGPTAGGHNAPPRGPLVLEQGQPVYGPRDVPDLEKIRVLGRPFWLAGSYASPEKLRQARELGAAGVQVGTVYAFCAESGVEPGIKARVLANVRAGASRVFTDPLASPTGFPFKVVQLAGTLSEASVYEARERRCDLGYLRELYRRSDGKLGYRCPAEPVEDYVRKGGRVEEARGRKCICNGLVATVGLGQLRRGALEPPIVTAGDDFDGVAAVLGDQPSYDAAEVTAFLLGRTTSNSLRQTIRAVE